MTRFNSHDRAGMVFPRKAPLAAGVLALMLSGCLAQQAELNQVRGDLSGKIQKLDQRDKELQQTVKDAKQEVNKLISDTRARLTTEISKLQDEDFRSFRGDLEKSNYQVDTVKRTFDEIKHDLAKRIAAVEKAQTDQAAAAKTERDRLHDEVNKVSARLDGINGRLETINTTIATMVKTLGGRLDDQEKGSASGEMRVQQLEKQLENQNRSLGEQMAQYKSALADYKKVLATLGEKLVQEEQRTAELTAKVSGRNEAITNKLDTDAKTTTAHLNEVNKSVGSVAKALETMSGQLIARIEEQDRRVDDLAKSLQTAVQAVDGQLAGLHHTVTQVQSAQTSTASRAPVDAAPVTAHEPVASSQPIQAQPASVPVHRETHAREAYDHSITTFKQGNLDIALHGFAQFLTEYPTSDLAPNAQYWLGECYYGKKDYARAVEAFDRVKIAYPNSEKVPAALLKKGFAYLALKDRNRASSVWRQVVDGYPNSPEAGKALEKLAQLKQIR